MVVFPNAKVNLGLDVLRKRNDGYHDISTVMVGVDWCDVLEIVPSRDGCDHLSVTGHKVDCPVEDNLVMKALRTMRLKQGELIPAVEIYLHKNIPDGAGLGGGSADAAFTVTALNKLFNLNLTAEEMADIAAHVGSDCPFFIYNKPMLAQGRGELLSPLPGLEDILAPYKVVIIKPLGASVSTRVAYSGITPAIPETPIERIVFNEVASWKDTLTNAFEKSIFAHTTEPESIKRQLYELGAVYASMTGSGSSVFALFERDKVPANIKERFAACNSHVGSFVL